ncbi:MAG: DUF2807 domain-containing protein [Bacteroidales bacterium]|nr:DUF2807 domain-containing protein [Bacteroidales bacterium]MDD2204020.1 DUF2807 domain-containing protein [Bacteroidales bacterium]MDD3152208.1 DUF2807 domain-containing protein [Bacteroidales bacterium]MDD3913392.1 DUF2807 domain-containing protein [Bacteroidales bacterium]MDD4633187.1 DUF2807 domain-containing protein [Bacteroidales bacterium]
MKTNKLLAVLIFLPVILASCDPDEPQITKVNGDGELVTQTLYLINFDKMYVYDNYITSLNWFQDKYYLDITAESSLVPYIVTEVNDNVLTIKDKDYYELVFEKPLLVNVYAPNEPEVVLNDVSRLNIYNYANESVVLYVKDKARAVVKNSTITDFKIIAANSGVLEIDTINCNTLDINLSVSAKGYINTIKVESLKVKSTTAADCTFSGTAEDAVLVINSSGSINAIDLEVQTCTFSSDNSGDLYVNVKDKLSGTILGSGNVYYTGKANVDDVVIKGSGSLIKL